ncbi:MAG: hypothetical protein ACJ76Y_15965 [Thermoanaerobaculia bacterium]
MRNFHLITGALDYFTLAQNALSIDPEKWAALASRVGEEIKKGRETMAQGVTLGEEDAEP